MNRQLNVNKFLRIYGLFAITIFNVANVTNADEFSFDVSEYAKKPFEYSIYGEARIDSLKLNPESTFYQLWGLAEKYGVRNNSQTGLINLTAKYQIENFSAKFNGLAQRRNDNFEATDQSVINSAYISFKPSVNFNLDIGKQSLKWGKSYAWNLLGFAERAKDNNDPDATREGWEMVSADYIENFDSPLKTIAFTPVLIPVDNNINNEYGAKNYLNPILKVYMLLYNTDIDIVWQGAGSKTSRWGFDFSRNINSAFEVHGEWVRISAVETNIIKDNYLVEKRKKNINSFLLGVRYLSEQETTWIAEYYNNGSGYSEDEITLYHKLYKSAQSPSQKKIIKENVLSYNKSDVGRQYLFVKVSQKEPYDILYFTPSLTLIQNLDDNSKNIGAEFLYTGFTNWELRLKANSLIGSEHSEFGEKQSQSKIEFIARYYF